MDYEEAAERIARARYPCIQIDTNLWAVMRGSDQHPEAMILGLTDTQDRLIYFVQTWHPTPEQRRVISEHDTLDDANRSVRWKDPLENHPSRRAAPKMNPDGSLEPATEGTHSPEWREFEREIWERQRRQAD